MQREEIIQICDREILEAAAVRFGTRKDALKIFPGHQYATNLAYEYEIDKKPLILRVSFSPGRTIEKTQAELHFVNYLSENGVNVSKPVRSQNGNYVETIQAAGIPFYIVSFVKGKGMRIPDNGNLYRTDAPIEEYFHNWGRILGQMHALTKNYFPESDEIKRPEWFDLHNYWLTAATQLPDQLHRVEERIQSLIEELKSLPRNKESFGLIHGDFYEGNFTVDYTNGDITVFDFDDSCYFWFMYEIAVTWQGGINRAKFLGLSERKAFMEHYMEQVMEGYNRENSLSAECMELLPMFIKLIQVQEFLHSVQYFGDSDEEMQARLKYKIKCIEEGIPYMGFFDSIYSTESPFSLQ